MGQISTCLVAGVESSKIQINSKMEALTLLSKNDIQEIVNAAVADAMKQIAPKPIRKTNLDKNEAVDYLSQIGYKCTLSTLYKASANNEVPVVKFGRKLLFNADDLTKWVENKRTKTIDIAMVVAQSANAKMVGR